MAYTRNNAWDNNGTFQNTSLLWYAKGVGIMQTRALDDLNSWWFFAAIHGEYLNETNYPGWGSIPGPPQVPTTPLPSKSIQDSYWNQCQHQSWYFPPWHRGYLLALEAQIRAAVVSLGGPKNWALPYWNYLGPNNQYKMPPAFAQQTLPDGSPNPLFVEARYGPQNDGDIFIPIPPVSEQCQDNTLYTGSNPNTPRPGYGGPNTGFSHSGRLSGNLESNPHNQVHVDVGGQAPQGNVWGLMSDPGLAALDPIFYLHHANIDRMWAEWNAKGNSNPTASNWLNGPAAVGQREFIMPMPDCNAWVYTPAQVNSLSQLNYEYADLSSPAPTQPVAFDATTRRLTRLGLPPTVVAQGDRMDNENSLELVGTHDGTISLKSSGARVQLRLAPEVNQQVISSFAATSEGTLPDQVYLELENVRGAQDAYKLTVNVNGQTAGTVALFGLRRASMEDGQHGGQGLTFVLDVTEIIDNLHMNNALDVDSLDVRITPNNSISEDANISVGRISIYRQSYQ